MPLRRTSHVQWPPHGKEAPFVIEPVHLFRSEVASAGTIHDEGVVVPAIPKPADDLDEFIGALVALIMFEMLIAAEVSTRCRVSGRYDVPSCAAATQMIQGCELSRKVERLGVACRGRCNQSHSACYGRHRGEQGQRLEIGDILRPSALG